ncbi:MAG: hypothetical protein M1819_003539 [Sarea resinae]|nr:MAG: hypothetical protein M1819_003539 [Sarea resinae]
MSTAKRRKVTANGSNAFAVAPPQRTIQAFGRISKAQPTTEYAWKKDPVKVEPTSTSIQIDEKLETVNGRKRKIVVSEEVEESGGHRPQKPISPNDSSSQVRSNSSEEEADAQSKRLLKTPRKSSAVPRDNPADTPTKGARGLLQSLKLPSTPPEDIHNYSTATCSRKCSASPLAHKIEILPEELQDLIGLYSAFLGTLSFHRAHNGSTAPADLRELIPGIERSWSRRRVSLESIRRVLGVAASAPPSESSHDMQRFLLRGIVLSDYGSGRICVESTEEDEKTCSRAGGSVFDETKLKRAFTHTLTCLWMNSSVVSTQKLDCKDAAQDPDRKVYVDSFIAQLPLAPILPCPSLQKTAPLYTKGQRLLSDLKAGAIKAQERAPQSKSTGKAGSEGAAAAATKTAKATQDRGKSLLERIRAKELIQSTLPPPPSRADLARQSALQRLEEVAAVLSLLTASSSASPSSPAHHRPAAPTAINSKNQSKATITKDDQQTRLDTYLLPPPSTSTRKPPQKQAVVSFPLPTLLATLRTSLPNPISADEAACCIHLLADTVAPEWVKVVRAGTMEAVVLETANWVGSQEVGRRVSRVGDDGVGGV